MSLADGYCKICRKPVPERMTNRFFCSHSCREVRLSQTIKNSGYETKIDPVWGLTQGRKIENDDWNY